MRDPGVDDQHAVVAEDRPDVLVVERVAAGEDAVPDLGPHGHARSVAAATLRCPRVQHDLHRPGRGRHADPRPALGRGRRAVGRRPDRPRDRRALRTIRARRRLAGGGGARGHRLRPARVRRIRRAAGLGRLLAPVPRRPRGAARRRPARGPPGGRSCSSATRSAGWSPTATPSPIRRGRSRTPSSSARRRSTRRCLRWQRSLARVLTHVAPTLQVKNAFDGTILSRDPAVAERYLADPLNHHATTTRLGAEALAEQKRATAALDRLTSRRSSIHGGDDRLVPTASSELFASASERHPPDVSGSPPREPQRARGRGRHRRRRRLAAVGARVSITTEYRLRGARTR